MGANEIDKRPVPRGGQVGNKSGSKHGYYSLVALRKEGKKDLRRRFWRVFEERKGEYTSALGGDVSTQELTIVEDTVWADFYIAAFDSYLSQRNIIRKGRPHPCFEVRIKLAAHRRENLKLLGTKRRVKEMTLQDYLQGLSGGEEDSGEGHQDDDHVGG